MTTDVIVAVCYRQEGASPVVRFIGKDEGPREIAYDSVKTGLYSKVILCQPLEVITNA